MGIRHRSEQGVAASSVGVRQAADREGGATHGHAHDVFASPDFNIFYNAGTLIIICARPIGHFVAADCWLAAENLMLAACAMGLGSCVIGSALMALDIPEIKNQLGIPTEFSAVAPIIVGHPRGETAEASRREPLVLSWNE